MACAGASDPAVTPIDLPRVTSLPQFAGGYARQMLWGSYRPGLYLGACRRTPPPPPSPGPPPPPIRGSHGGLVLRRCKGLPWQPGRQDCGHVLI